MKLLLVIKHLLNIIKSLRCKYCPFKNVYDYADYDNEVIEIYEIKWVLFII